MMRISTFSGAVDITRIFTRHQEDGTAARTFGDETEIEGTEVDLMYLIKKNAESVSRPRLYVSCGTRDFLYDQHQQFIPALQENGWDVTGYDEPDAVHEWGFWDREIRKFIEFITIMPKKGMTGGISSAQSTGR